jgi:hypothetical protein
MPNIQILFGYFTEILLLRRGPQDLPTSRSLLATLILLNIVAGTLLYSGQEGGSSNSLQSIVDIGLSLVMYSAVLNLRGCIYGHRAVTHADPVSNKPAAGPGRRELLCDGRTPHVYGFTHLEPGCRWPHFSPCAGDQHDGWHCRCRGNIYCQDLYPGSGLAELMHIHILGACGTFMGGLAVLAKQAGHRVSGSDQHTYPPMSTQLIEHGIELTEGYDTAQLQPHPDLVIIGG